MVCFLAWTLKICDFLGEKNMPTLLGDVADHQEDPNQQLRSEASSNLELSLASHSGVSKYLVLNSHCNSVK